MPRLLELHMCSSLPRKIEELLKTRIGLEKAELIDVRIGVRFNKHNVCGLVLTWLKSREAVTASRTSASQST